MDEIFQELAAAGFVQVPGGGGGADANAVHYTADSGKTDAQKAQARENVNAASNAVVADAYDVTATYAVGDYCIHDGGLYECNTAISVAESWTAAHWTAANIGGKISQLKRDIAKIKNLNFRHGTVTLTNSDEFPFNSSQQTISLGTAMPDTNYVVSTQILSSVGNPGEIEVKDKLVNGFKLNCTGSANSAVVDYIVIGGFTA